MSVGTIRKAYNAIRDRLEADSTFNDYFAMIEYDKQTQEPSFPYCRVDFSNFESNPSGITKIEEPFLSLDITIIVKPDDNDRLSETLLNAIEVFINAYDGSEPTFNDGSKALVLDVTKNFSGIEQLTGGQIQSTGEIINKLQSYQMGGL